MKRKFLFVIIFTTIIIVCVNKKRLFSYPMDLPETTEEVDDYSNIIEPSLNDIFKKKDSVCPEIPKNVLKILQENNLVLKGISKFVHSCKELHNGSQCFLNGSVLSTSVVFVKKDDDVVNNLDKIEIRFNLSGKAYKFIREYGNRLITAKLGKEIKI